MQSCAMAMEKSVIQLGEYLCVRACMISDLQQIETSLLLTKVVKVSTTSILTL